MVKLIEQPKQMKTEVSVIDLVAALQLMTPRIPAKVKSHFAAAVVTVGKLVARQNAH